jgi:hypothetical protein
MIPKIAMVTAIASSISFETAVKETSVVWAMFLPIFRMMNKIKNQMIGNYGNIGIDTTTTSASVSLHNPVPDLIPDPPERGQDIGVIPHCHRRVRETLVAFHAPSGNDRTALLRMITNGNHFIERRPLEGIEPLGAMIPDINADLRHRFNGAGMDPGRRRTGAVRLPSVPFERPEQPLGHLRPRGVVGADKENLFFPFNLRHPLSLTSTG